MPFRLLFLVFLIPLAAVGQGDTLTLSQASSGSKAVTLNVSLTAPAGQELAALQWTLSYSPVDFTAIQVATGPAAAAAGKFVSCAGTPAAYTCIVAGVNMTTMASGVVAVISLTVSSKTKDTESFVAVENLMATSATATAIPISGTGIAAMLAGINISDSNLQFIYQAGGTVPPSQTVDISNNSGSPLSWTATWKAPWITVTPVSGTTPSKVTIAVAPKGLGISVNTDTIEITAAGGGQASINVTLAVNTPELFVPIVPCRIVDTRNSNGEFGGPAIPGGTSRNFELPLGGCGIPSNAMAYSLNVAVVPAQGLGYVTVWPAGQAQPLVATLTSVDGRIRSNAAIVPAGTAGAISVFATDMTQLVLDINGFFVRAGSGEGQAFYPMTPCRIADTRNPAGSFGGPDLAAQSVRPFAIKNSSTCIVPAAADAYALNFTALPRGDLGYLTAWPDGQPQPVVASLNAVTGATTANAVIVPAGANGDVSVFASDATDLIIDANGYFAGKQSGGLSLYSVPPCRVLDTRLNGGAPFHGSVQVPISGICGIPATARAFVLNATVVPGDILNFLSLWPQGTPQPLVSTLNAVDGAITSNLAIVPGKNGAIEAFASEKTHLILDIFGYFAP